jgi:hypothetical protein
MGMNRFAVLAATGGVLFLAGCETPGPGPSAGIVTPPPAPGQTVQFRTQDFAWSQGKGSGRIDGKLTYKQRGVAYTCPQGVVLTPETPWVKRRMEILYGTPEKAALPADEVRSRTPREQSQDYQAFVRRATCDASGAFSYRDLPDGAWYVITVAHPAAGPDIAIIRRVVTQSGKVLKLEM